MKFIPCTIKALDPLDATEESAAAHAEKINPANAARFLMPPAALSGPFGPSWITAVTNRKWASTGVNLTVTFREKVKPELRRKILAYANKWGDCCNAVFRGIDAKDWTEGDVRVSLEDQGYWCYLGTDVLLVARHRHNMSLQQFSLKTPDSEYDRVVVHEFGHALGFPHEHLRREIVDRIDRKKALAYFKKTQGWDEAVVTFNVLTPLEEKSLTGSSPIDPTSVMCYQLPGAIFKDGKPVVGGTKISPLDAEYVAKMYPKLVVEKAKAPAGVMVDYESRVVYAPPGWTLQTR